MYINITGSPNNKDVYIYQSYRKDNGKKLPLVFTKNLVNSTIFWNDSMVMNRNY